MAQHHRRCRPGFCVAWCALAEKERSDAREQAIRTDERAKVIARVVAIVDAQAGVKSFRLGQRVTVHAAASPGGASGNIPGGACGTVVRLRTCDDGAWVELDALAHDEVHPFPADDRRARHVLAYPEDCHHIATAKP